ncbi:Fusaric acid resistance protein-like-domain-containing protein [Mucidula mucida]|nr:Fusaric acid resistance protein-like-domain-containing protein [Mucidula mucida]
MENEAIPTTHRRSRRRSNATASWIEASPPPSILDSAHVQSPVVEDDIYPSHNVFKCALAYFIGSLFTFSPYLSSFIGDLRGPGERRPHPSGHMIATIAVYYNPAKTMGAMLEADLFCLFGVVYAAFVCLSSMSMFWWFGDLVAILWVGVSMSFLAWMKVWMGSPQFNTACSMISMIIFVVIVKEGGLRTLLSMFFIVLCGTVISNLVCYLVFPQTATHNLQVNMTKTLDSFSTLLNMLTNTFLLEEPIHHMSQEKLAKAVESHQNSFTSLKKNLKEAKSEWAFSGRPSSTSPLESGDPRRRAYEDAVDCLNRLAQHLNGLRSGIRLQYDLTKAGVVKRKRRKKGKNRSGIVDESAEVDDEDTAMLKAAAVMFGDLVDDLGPPLKALTSTCVTSIKRLRESFVHAHKAGKGSGSLEPHEFTELVESIERSLMRFESTSNHAVMRLYRKSDLVFMDSTLDGEMSASRMSISSRISAAGKGENLALSGSESGESIFLVYFFIFTLQEFATELTSLVDAIERIYNYEKNRVSWKVWFKRSGIRARERWHRLMGWMKKPKDKTGRPGLKRKISSFILPNQRQRPTFPKVRPHAPNTVLTPARSNLTYVGRLKQMLWATGKRMGERDIKYAVKAGMATALLASPAFFDNTRQWFLEYQGDWALISFFVVMSPTIGATNFLSFHRVLWTLVGATIAASIYTLFSESPVVLAIFGFFFSLPCFYYLVTKPAHASAARFALLTYNLTCLYCYNSRDKDLSVVYVAYHRALAVTAGVLYAAFIARFWWPAEARRELGTALSQFCLNIGWLYTRLVASNSFAPEYRTETNEDEEETEQLVELTQSHQSGLTRLNNSIQEFMAMELHLQIKLIELQGLLAQTQHEPRLKGPFPVKLYRGVLTSLQTILDKLHSMRCVTTREEWYTSVRQDFIIPVNKERHEMVGNIILYFSTLASAFQLKMPLPPYLPPAEASRQRLVEAIRKLDVVRNRDVKGSRQLLFFAYALTMKGVTQELETLGRTLQEAFGVIGQSPDEFEALFVEREARKRIDGVA